MGFIDAFILMGLFLVGLPVSWMLGWLLAKLLRVPALERLFPAIMLGIVIAGYPLALRFFGEPGRGRVVARNEDVRVFSSGGDWTHQFRLTVRYLPRHAERADFVVRDAATDSITLAMSASRAQFDHTPVGAIVPIRYVSFRPSLAKLEGRTLGDLASEALQSDLTRLALVVVACIIVAAMLSGWHPGSAVLRTVRLGGFLICLFAGFGAIMRAMFHPAIPANAPPATESAVARVASVHRITDGPLNRQRSHSRLAVPYDVVELELVPRTLSSSVRAIDVVDTTSARGLAVDRRVRVHYAASDPRVARIDGATRTFDAANLRDQRATVRWVSLGLIALLAASFVFERRKRRAR